MKKRRSDVISADELKLKTGYGGKFKLHISPKPDKFRLNQIHRIGGNKMNGYLNEKFVRNDTPCM